MRCLMLSCSNIIIYWRWNSSGAFICFLKTSLFAFSELRCNHPLYKLCRSVKGWIKVFECRVATQGVTWIYSSNSQVWLFPVQTCKREISILTANLCLSCIIKPKMPHSKGLPVVLPKARILFGHLAVTCIQVMRFGWEVLYIVLELIFHFWWLWQRH